MLSWISTAVGLLIGDWILQGVHVDGLLWALLAAAVLGFVNMTIKPILFILTLPITIVTLGLFYFVVNAMMLGLTSWLMPGFDITGLGSGVALAIIIALTQAVAHSMFGDKRRYRSDPDLRP